MFFTRSFENGDIVANLLLKGCVLYNGIEYCTRQRRLLKTSVTERVHTYFMTCVADVLSLCLFYSVESLSFRSGSKLSHKESNEYIPRGIQYLLQF